MPASSVGERQKEAGQGISVVDRSQGTLNG